MLFGQYICLYSVNFVGKGIIYLDYWWGGGTCFQFFVQKKLCLLPRSKQRPGVLHAHLHLKENLPSHYG